MGGAHRAAALPPGRAPAPVRWQSPPQRAHGDRDLGELAGLAD